jgi:autotransporter-associated beta strand protein
VQNAVVDADVAAILATGNFASGACIGFDTAAGNRTYADAVSNTAAGALGLYKIGVNTLTLTNANTYDGNTVVNGGIVVVRNNSALGSTNGYTLVNRVGGTAPLYTDSTGQLQLDGSGGALTLDENFILNGAEQYGYLGALRSLSGNNTLNGWIKVGAGGARIGNNSGTFTLNGPITREWPSYNPMLVLNPSGMLIVSNRIELGTGGVNFHSGGTVWLCSTGNTWTGYSQIQYGCIVRLGADHALPTGIKLTLGNPGTPPGNGTLDLYGFDQTVGGLIQNGTDPSFPNNLIRNSQAGDPSTLTVSQAAGVSDFFSGRLRENLSLVKAGAANSVLTLNGTNSFSGSTLVTGGTLTLSPTGTLGVACTNIAVSAGTLSVQNSDALSDDATVSLAAGGAAKLSLAAGVTEVVSFLFIDGDLQRPGTYGSADSGATFKDSTTFSGTGVLRVLHGKSIGTTFTVK